MSDLALLLDDDADFGAALLPAFAAAGLRLVQARRAGDVERALQGARPAVYLVDGLLPDADGPRWIEALRARDRTTPVAFVSAFWKDLRSFDRLRKELGVAVIAQKPVAPAILAAQIRSLVGGGAAAGSQQAPLPPRAHPEPAAAQLGALRQGYARELPRQVEVLARLALDRRPASAEQARQLAHRLRGTAGTYGFHEVSRIAARIEEELVTAAAPVAPERLGVLREAAEAVARVAAPPADPPTGPRVLAIGLSPQAAAPIATQLSAAGLSVELEPELAAGVRRARAVAPDVVVLCGRSGPEAAAAAAELRADPGAPVLLVGGGDGLAARVATAHAGVALTLAQGAAPDAVAHAVRQLADGRAAEQPTVLVVDDDPAFAAQAVAVLRTAGLRGRMLDDPGRLLEHLAAVRPDALLLDVVMPGFGGVDLCRMLRSMPEWQDLPILLVTAQTDPATRLAAYEAGADDLVHKPVVARELLVRVAARVERRRLLRERADRDALTGVASRRAFLEALERRLSEVRRRGGALSLAVLDLDRFKHLNDTHGHLSGDRVLAGLGGLLTRRLRREDLRGRWGGEEFVLAIADDAPVAAGVVEQLRTEFAALRFDGDDGARFSASFSAGVASCPADGAGARALFDAADRRCYAAKRAGRDRVVAADLPAPESPAGGRATPGVHAAGRNSGSSAAAGPRAPAASLASES